MNKSKSFYEIFHSISQSIYVLVIVILIKKSYKRMTHKLHQFE